MHKTKKYAFVVLNWNGKKDTCQCLDSLDKIDYEDDFDIIVIDNGSGDGSPAYIQNHINQNIKKDVRFITLSKNTGFTGGHIEGLKHTSADIVCLLNNDAVVASNILKEVDSVINILGDNFGAIGGRAYFWNQEQKAFDIWNEFFTYQKIDPITATAYTIKGDPGESLAPRVVDNVSGACVFVSRKAIDSAGYLDNKFFAYYEETDMFARFKRCGFEIYYCPTVRYWHRFEPSSGSHGASSKHIKNFSSTLIARNQFLFAFKNFEPIFLVRFLFWYYARFALTLVRFLVKPSSRESSLILIKTTLGNFSKIPALLKDRRDLKRHLPEIIGYNTKILHETHKKSVVFFEIPLEDTLSYILKSTDENDRIHLRRSLKCTETFNHRCMRLRVDESNVYGISGAASRTNTIIVIEGKRIRKKLLEKEFARINPDRPYRRKSPGLFVFNRAFMFQLAADNLNPGQTIDWNQQPVLENKTRVVINKIFRKLTNKPVKLVFLTRDYLLNRNRLYGRSGVARAILGLLKNLPSKPARMLEIMRAGAHEHRLYRLRTLENTNNISVAKLSGIPLDSIPVFINCRDRVNALKQTIDGVIRAGFSQIYLIDNQSSYPHLLEYYSETSHQVILLGENMGHKAPWESLAVKLLAGGNPYVVTDPDIVLSENYSPAVTHSILKLFDIHPGYVKIGAGLQIDDLPDYYDHKNTVQKWEAQFWAAPIKNSNGLIAYDAEIDTTFAIYRPNLGYITLPSIRLGGLHTAKHLPWYQNSKKPSKEEKYYREHASSAVNTWDKDTLPEYLKDYIS